MNALRNPRAEAQTLVGGRFDARVLEPSAPADLDPPFFADDPVSLDWVRDGAEPIVPAGMAGGLDWNEWLQSNQKHSDWVAQRWLGGPRKLPEVPPNLAATRVSLHKLAMFVVAPVRYKENGKFGLRYTLGGFGTPFFGDDRQIRVQGVNLIDQDGDDVRSTKITSLSAAAEFLGTAIDTETATEHDSPEIGDADAPLVIDPVAADFLGAWYGMAFAALELVRADDASVDASRPQIWPGHFDPAIEIGDEVHRASYGASPGDHSIAEPYLYVSIWWPEKIGVDAADPVWNAPSFTGAVLKVSDFDPERDPVEVAAEFLAGRTRLSVTKFGRERRLVLGVAIAAVASAAVLIWVGSRSNDGDAGEDSGASVTTTSAVSDGSETSEPETDSVTTTEPEGGNATDALWPSDASQSETDAERDKVHPALGQLTFAERVDPQASVNAGGRQWVLSELPTETRNQLVDDGLAGRDLDPFGGEVLIVEDDTIMRAFPMNEFPPTFLTTDGTLVYAGRTGDGGYPDSALLAINARTFASDRIVMRSSGPDAPSFYSEVWEEGLSSQREAFGEGNYLQALLAMTGTLESGNDWVVRANPERGLCAAIGDIDYGCDDESQFINESDPVETPRIIALPVPPNGIDTDQLGVLVYGFLPAGATTVEVRNESGAALGFESFVDADMKMWVVSAVVSNEPFSVAYLGEDGTVLLEWPDG